MVRKLFISKILWDTEPPQKFRTIEVNPYRGAHGIILMFSLTDRISFQNLEKWYQEIERYASMEVNVVLVGNKSDLVGERVVTFEEGKVKIEMKS